MENLMALFITLVVIMFILVFLIIGLVIGLLVWKDRKTIQQLESEKLKIASKIKEDEATRSKKRFRDLVGMAATDGSVVFSIKNEAGTTPIKNEADASDTTKLGGYVLTEYYYRDGSAIEKSLLENQHSRSTHCG